MTDKSGTIPEVINGIRLQVVADYALGVFNQRRRTAHETLGPYVGTPPLPPTPEEEEIASKAKAVLDSLRRKGYAREQCRLGFWNKIVSEARKAKK